MIVYVRSGPGAMAPVRATIKENDKIIQEVEKKLAISFSMVIYIL